MKASLRCCHKSEVEQVFQACHGNPRAIAVALVTLLLCLSAFAPVARAADTTIVLKTVGSAPVDMNAPLGFAEAVKVALARSEALRSTQIDIEVGKLAEKDAWYRMFPKLVLVANYDVPIIQDNKNGTSYKSSINISFSTGAYDPISAYIGHDASKVSVKLSEVLHVIAIEEMLEKIGYAFIDINTAEENIACRRNLVAELESLEKYAAQKLNAGSISPLEHKMVQQRLALARLELLKAIRRQALARRNLKQLIGLDDQDNAVFNTGSAIKDFTSEADLQQALQPEALLKHNLKLQAQALQEKLQSFNIRLAQAEHIPKISFGFRTPDPMSNQGGNLPYYAGMQASVPIWSWGETMRGVERAELKLQGAKLQGKLLYKKIQQGVDELRLVMETSAEAASIAKNKAELQRLEALRKEIGYNANSVSYDALVTAREAALYGQLEAIKAQQALTEARLNLQVVTGRLISEYVQVNYGELEEY